MKVLIFVCFIAVCASLPITGKQIVVQDGLITVTSSKYQFSIIRSADPRKIDILYKTTGMKGGLELSEPTKLETTDSSETLGENFDKMLGKDYTHFDVVERIFSQYGSMVDDVTYNKILNRIGVFVNNAILNKHMFALFKYLESPEEMQKVYGLSKSKTMVDDVVMPMKDGVSTRMIETSDEEAEKMRENKSAQKERLTIVPLQKNNSPKFIGAEKYLDMTTPMQRIPTNQYQHDLMKEIPQSMLYQQYVNPMYLQKYQGLEQGLSYQPMINRMYEQTYTTPMNRFWETVMVPQTQKQQMIKNMIFQRTVPQDLMNQYPVQKDSRQVSEYIMRNMMEDPMMEEKMAEQKMMNRNMMYKPTMDHMMTENMMTPRMSELMVENIMEPYMQNERMMEEQVMHQKMMTPKMAEQLKTQRLMEQRMMHQGMMDEYMMDELKY